MMKLFSIKLIQYTTLLILFLLLASLAIQIKYNRDIIDATYIPADKKILILGDSHTEAAINDKYCDGMINKSYSSEGYYHNYLKLLDILDNNNHEISTLVISYHITSLLTSKDNIFISSDNGYYYNKYAPCLHRYNNRPTVYGLSVNNREYYYHYLNEILQIPTIDKVESLLSSGTLLTEQYIGRSQTFNNYGSFNIDDVHHKQTLEKIGKEQISDIQYNLLYLIAQKASESNIKLVLLNTPCHKVYNKYRSTVQIKNLENVAHDLEERFGVKYINLMDYQLSNECYFDTSHLNQSGANTITPILIDTLIKLGLYKK